MKNYSLAPTDTNILKALHSDSIDRNDSLFYFINLIEQMDDCCSIAINSDWGSGKTFFVKQLKLILDYFSPESKMEPELELSLKNFIEKHNSEVEINCSGKYISLYYDAWEHDNDQDPILSLIYSIVTDNNIKTVQTKRMVLSDIAANLLELVTGKDISKIITSLRGSDPLEEIHNSRNIRSLLLEFFDALIVEKSPRLVIFIDELDRCKPIYAVRFLERIKHYFSDERITFVFSINVDQLQHTIKNYYGYEFDAERYLDKFFDFKIPLPPVNTDMFLKTLEYYGTYIYDLTSREVISYFGFSIRELEKYIRNIKIAAYKITHSTYTPDSPKGRAYKFGLNYFIPILIGLMIRSTKDYNQFLEGNRPEIAVTILYSQQINIQASSYIYNFQETQELVDIPKRLEEIYYAAFKNTEDYTKESVIGQLNFSYKIKEKWIKVASLLSDEAAFDF